MTPQIASRPTDEDYRRLLEFRTGIRRFLHWTDDLARSAGLTPMQHLLLLAIRGHPAEQGPAISDVADELRLAHNSAVELVDRAEEAGLVLRIDDPRDRRRVRLKLSGEGDRRLESLANATMEELARQWPGVRRLWAGLAE